MKIKVCETIPEIANVDVLVLGGGAGGFGAAVMAARTGARTILVERHGSLGGTTSFAEISPMMPNNYAPDGEREHAVSLDQPIYVEWLKQMYSYLPDDLQELCSSYYAPKSKVVSKDIASLAMEDLCLEAGVELLFHFDLLDVECDNNLIRSAIFQTPGGLQAIRAKVFVDASGDGNLAVAAGCSYEQGDENGVCQPMTTCFKLSHIDPKRSTPQEIQQLFDKAKAEGVIDTCREDLLRFNYYDDDVIHFNSTRVIGKAPLDPRQRSEAELEGRRQLRQLLRWMRSSVPGFEQCRLHSMGREIGVRESRRIKGMRSLSQEAFVERQKFSDGIARCNYPIDIHRSTGSGTDMIFMGISDYYEVPYGCLVAADVGNLLLAGRLISTSRAINASVRVMPVACSTGQAAGAAAAMAVKQHCSPQELSGEAVRDTLRRQGAYL